jgi:uncharacterized protein
MGRVFQGRNVLPGDCRGEALVSHAGFNILASFQQSFALRLREAVCGDQDNPDLYKKVMTGKIICLPVTIGSTGGGLVLQAVANLGLAPQALLFSKHVDSLAAAGVILADVWLGKRIVVVDNLGDEFLDAVQTGQKVAVYADGKVEIL